MKKCCICKTEKPFNEFSKATRNKDGLQTACKKCQTQQRLNYDYNLCECGNRKKKESKRCGFDCRGKTKIETANGNKKKTKRGYILVLNHSHPYATKRGYVPEHRLVMEEILGRYLFPHENVHHLNGQKGDNDGTNLELWSTSQPSGQRVEDKLKWCKEFLEQYQTPQDKINWAEDILEKYKYERIWF